MVHCTPGGRGLQLVLVIKCVVWRTVVSAAVHQSPAVPSCPEVAGGQYVFQSISAADISLTIDYRVKEMCRGENQLEDGKRELGDGRRG